MKSKTFRRTVRNAAVLMLAMTTSVLAQTPPLPAQFSGVINDYSPSTTVTPMGPWEMRGPWSLTLNGASGTANFTAELTMELSDYTRNSTAPLAPPPACSTLTTSRSRAAQSRKFQLAGSR